uniref:Uncharacterized protein n=1 Tax=Amphimedon queenslandica TaxID=400682 RepID=A0A1X7V9S3_AMPQE
MAEAIEKQRWTVTIILLWLFLVRLFDPSIVNSVQNWSAHQKELYDDTLNSSVIVFYLFLPLLVLLADMKLGRLHTAILSAAAGALSSLIFLIFLIFSSKSYLVTAVLDPITLVTRVLFEISLLCLGADQLVEMSSNSDEMSSYVWWWSWCVHLSIMITSVASCLSKNQGHFDTYIASAHFILLVVIIIVTLKIKKWTIRYSYTKNPLKLISGVLWFALKHKSPTSASALSYLNESKPPRIDLGKMKYGGPFFEKDVESVKTFLRLIPLVCIITMINFPFQLIGRLSSENSVTIKHCLISGTYFIGNCVAIFGVPLYRFILKPYCFKFLKLSMLKKIGIGIALTVLGKLGYVIIDLYLSIPAYNDSNEALCLLQPDNFTNAVLTEHKMYVYLEITPKAVNALGFLMINVGSFEFIFAQSPHPMRGLLIGLWFSAGSVYEITGYLLVKPFKELGESLVPSCELYVLIMNFVFMFVSFVLFLVYSRKYRLHNNEETESECHQYSKSAHGYGSMSNSLAEDD